MAISDLDSCISGLSKDFFFYKQFSHTGINQNQSVTYMSSWMLSGAPSNAPVIFPGPSGYAFDTTTGGDMPYWTFPFIQPTSTKRTYLNNGFLVGAHLGQLTFCDRIWQSQVFPLTGNDIFTVHSTGSFPFPSRDETGGNNGYGYLTLCEIVQVPSAQFAANKPDNPTIIYTNHLGVPNRTGQFSPGVFGNFSQSNVLPVGAHIPIYRTPGDEGIRSIQQIRPSGAFSVSVGPISGQIVVYRIIETFNDQLFEAGSSMLGLPKQSLYSGTTPFALLPISTNTGFVFGSFNYIHC